jgi:hypothetical protein
MLKVGVPLALAAGAVGLAQGIGSSVREGMMETAFGDPNADAAFLGRNLSARFMLGSVMGGPVGAVMQASAPQDQFMVNPMRPTIGTSALGAIAGGGIGATVGSMLGKKYGVAGGAIGALIGGAVAPGAYTMGHIRRNSEFYKRSPYSRSRQIADELNASGEIVLGMHNSRGGF